MAALLLSSSPGGTAHKPALSPASDLFTIERALALMVIVVAALYLRVLNPLFSTAYMDESVYVIYGRMFLSHHFEAPLDTPLQWSFGWYLWPAMAAVADRVGGLLALRELAAGLGTITVVATYGFASRVFSKVVGLGSAAVMAVLAPAVLVSRIATRDTGSICFFALGLWAFAVAWGKNRKRDWILAALFFFAGFLCKYLIALYFPLLVILSLGKGKKPGFLFAAPLSAACAIYGALHFADLSHLLRYGSSYGSLRAPGNQAWSIYGWDRADFWLLVLPAVLVIFSRTWKTRALWLWAGAAIMLLFQWKSRADYDYWKHVNYSFLFLVPLAVAGVVFLALALQKQSHFGQMLGGICGVLALVAGTGWMGREQSAERFMFWPNVTPIVAYFENTLAPTDRVLVDDTVLRYYFQPVLHQPQITDPMYFRYKGREGVEAYQSATQDGVFSYIVLDGGIGEEARRMDAAVHSQLSGYQLQMMAADPTMGQNIEIYAKAKAPGSVAAKESDVRVLTPASNTVVSVSPGSVTVAEGMATGAHPGWYIRMEVFTDRWYAQGDRIEIAPGGSFRQEIYLSGEHRQQCFHILRTRLFDQADSVRAVSFNYGIARANPDGSIPACRPTLELNQPAVTTTATNP